MIIPVLDISNEVGSLPLIPNGPQVQMNHALISTVIVLTNHPYALYRKKCLQVGAKFFLDKSNEFEKVGEVLQGLIRDADRQAE